MNTIFKAIVGSQSYGTATANSDVDYKGVYMQDIDELISFGYKEQIERGKDEVYYEVRRFLQLLQSANPTVLELLYSPEDCVIQKDRLFEIIISNRDKFLTKKCRLSFGGYAVAQIQKAKGLDKKMNWEKEKTIRKTVLDFCYVIDTDSEFNSLSVKDWLKRQKKVQNHCGLALVDHFRYTYNLFYDHLAELKSENPKFEGGNYGYKGIVQNEDISNDISVSDIPKFAKRDTILYFNKDAYSQHCKDYKSYLDWLENRNTQRYIDIKGHKQQIDGKNLLHCRRLLDMAIEIATENTIRVRRPNADYLLKIRNGEVNLESIIEKAELDIKLLDELFEKSNLPEDAPTDFVNNLLLQIRHNQPQPPK
jgi:hypothetical protein